jgi:hypothetical protein
MFKKRKVGKWEDETMGICMSRRSKSPFPIKVDCMIEVWGNWRLTAKGNIYRGSRPIWPATAH